MKVCCQNCSKQEIMRFGSNNDLTSNFFMWPSGYRKKELDIYYFFCFSCSHFSEAAAKLSFFGPVKFEYFNCFKVDNLHEKCNMLGVSEPILQRLEKRGLISR